MIRGQNGSTFAWQAEADQGGRAKHWNVIGLTTPAGVVAEEVHYSPYGQATVHSKPALVPCLATANSRMLLDVTFSVDLDASDALIEMSVEQHCVAFQRWPCTATN